MDLQISGKVALVTGSNRGIGKATAITLSKGADVALLARNEKLLSQTKNEISSIAPNIKVEYFLCDTKSNEQVKDAVSGIEKLLGKLIF